MSDPFSMVYDALWSMAEASTVLASLVKANNRVKFDKPLREEISGADLPELALILTSAEGNLRSTSSSSSVIRQYQFIVSTGEMSVARKLLPLEFALYAAMAGWPAALATLRWPTGATDGFVKRTQLVSSDAGFADPERNRGIKGWSSVWTLEVEMHFKTLDLTEYGEA